MPASRARGAASARSAAAGAPTAAGCRWHSPQKASETPQISKADTTSPPPRMADAPSGEADDMKRPVKVTCKSSSSVRASLHRGLLLQAAAIFASATRRAIRMKQRLAHDDGFSKFPPLPPPPSFALRWGQSVKSHASSSSYLSWYRLERSSMADVESYEEQPVAPMSEKRGATPPPPDAPRPDGGGAPGDDDVAYATLIMEQERVRRAD